jgi:hypothetical protein
VTVGGGKRVIIKVDSGDSSSFSSSFWNDDIDDGGNHMSCGTSGLDWSLFDHRDY